MATLGERRLALGDDRVVALTQTVSPYDLALDAQHQTPRSHELFPEGCKGR